MPRPSIAKQGSQPLNVSDFELVRNAKGEWLLIVTQAPAAFLDNPMQTLEAHVDGNVIVITSAAATLQAQNILSSQYVPSLISDKPSALLFSVIDDDGIQHFSARMPMKWD